MWRKLAFLACLAANVAAQDVVSNATSGPWAAELNGTWRFHAGDDMRWASPSFDDSSWPSFQPPGTVPSVVTEKPYFWLRTKVQLGATVDPGLLLQPIAAAYEVYWDGQRIGNFGGFYAEKGLQPQYRSFHLANHLAKMEPHIIAIRAFNPGYISGPRLIDRTGNRVGEFAALREVETSLRAQAFLPYLLVLVSQSAVVLAGLYFLLLSPSVSQGAAFRWFGVFLAGYGLNAVVNAYARYWNVNGLDRARVAQTAINIGVAAMVEFSYALFRRRVPFAVRGLEVFLVFSVLFWPVPVVHSASWLMIFRHALFITAVLIPTVVAGSKLQRRSPESLITFVLFALMGILGLLTVLVSFYGLNVRTGFRLGEFRFNINAVILTLWIPAMAMQIHKINQRFRDEQQHLNGEMQAARRVQEILLPSKVVRVPGFEIDSAYQPATEVGGDFFQLFSAANDSLLVVVGDVSGKGMKAALLVSLIVGALRNRKSDQPGCLLGELNSTLVGQSEGGFTTCCCALFAPDGTVTIGNAGHLAPYRNGKEIETAPGLPLGVMPAASWDETHIVLQPGDRVVWMSDGIVEARNGKRDLLGFTRAQELAGRSVSEIARAAQEFGQEDDITVISITRQPVPAYVA